MIAEDGSDAASELWGMDVPVAASMLAYPEGRAALAAALRARRLSGDAYARAVADFEAVHQEIHLVGVDRELARRAGELAEAHGLRGYDAVHLAAAEALGEGTVLVTWDRGLAGAGLASRIAVAPPL